MKIATIVLLILPIFCTIVTTAIAQTAAHNRFLSQTYFGDSSHVFWTWYPNPFSPATIIPGRTENRKVSYCGDLSFYCDLSDSVTVVAYDQTDSAVYSIQVVSKIPPNFSLCYWLAGSQISPTQLPRSYVRGDSLSINKLMLVVSGKNKALRSYHVYVPEGWYFWMQSAS